MEKDSRPNLIHSDSDKIKKTRRVLFVRLPTGILNSDWEEVDRFRKFFKLNPWEPFICERKGKYNHVEGQILMFEHFICFVQAKEKEPIKMILPLKAIMRIRKLETKSNNAIEITSVKRLYKNNIHVLKVAEARDECFDLLVFLWKQRIAFSEYFDMVELDSLYERFKMLDARDQDCLKRDDFQRTLAPIIAFNDNKNLSNSDVVFEMFDSNQDGVLTFQDYVTGVALMVKGDVWDRLHFAFMKLDKDHDGFLKMDHFASEYTQLIFERLGVLDLLEIRQIFTLANLRTLFSALDTDRDGKISMEEFKRGLNDPWDIKLALKMVKINQLDKERREAIEAREREAKDEERRRNIAKLASFTKEITLGHTNWELVQYMLIGLNLAVEVGVQLFENYLLGGGSDGASLNTRMGSNVLVQREEKKSKADRTKAQVIVSTLKSRARSDARLVKALKEETKASIASGDPFLGKSDKISVNPLTECKEPPEHERSQYELSNMLSLFNPLNFSDSYLYSLPNVWNTQATGDDVEDKELKWSFRDFGALIFQMLRIFFEVPAEQYVASFSPVQNDHMLIGTLSGVEEVVSTGRSGSFFFKSRDSKYFLKTLPSVEESFLKKMLPLYYKYLVANPNTLLSRYFGLHDVSNGNRRIPFVVIANVFDSPLKIHEQYDLKGSTIDRTVNVEEPISGMAMKDMDFKKFGRSIKVGTYHRDLILKQIEKDVSWLESLGICDYSLLIGIHFKDREEKAKLNGSTAGEDTDNFQRKQNESAFRRDFGGITSTVNGRQGNEVYFIGIIDILTLFDLKKKAEHVLKTVKNFDNESLREICREGLCSSLILRTMNDLRLYVTEKIYCSIPARFASASSKELLNLVEESYFIKPNKNQPKTIISVGKDDQAPVNENLEDIVKSGKRLYINFDNTTEIGELVLIFLPDGSSKQFAIEEITTVKDVLNKLQNSLSNQVERNIAKYSLFTLHHKDGRFSYKELTSTDLVKSVIKVSFDSNEQDIRHLNSLLLAKPKEASINIEFDEGTIHSLKIGAFESCGEIIARILEDHPRVMGRKFQMIEVKNGAERVIAPYEVLFDVQMNWRRAGVEAKFQFKVVDPMVALKIYLEDGSWKTLSLFANANTKQILKKMVEKVNSAEDWSRFGLFEITKGREKRFGLVDMPAMLIDLDSSRLLFKRTTTTLPDNDLEDFDELDETPRQKEKNVMLGKPKFLRLLAAGYYSEKVAVYFPDENIARVSVNILTSAADVLLHLEQTLPDFSRTLFRLYKPEGGSQLNILSDDEVIFATIHKMMLRDEWPRLYLVQREYVQRPVVPAASSNQSNTAAASKLRNNATLPIFFGRSSFTMLQISAQTLASELVEQMQFLLGIEEEHTEEYSLLVFDGHKEWIVPDDLLVSKICSLPNIRFMYKWNRGEKTTEDVFDATGMSGEFISPAKTRKVHPITGQLRQLSEKQRKRKSHSLGFAINPDELKKAFEAEERLMREEESPRSSGEAPLASPRSSDLPPLVRRKASKRSALLVPELNTDLLQSLPRSRTMSSPISPKVAQAISVEASVGSSSLLTMSKSFPTPAVLTSRLPDLTERWVSLFSVLHSASKSIPVKEMSRETLELMTKHLSTIKTSFVVKDENRKTFKRVGKQLWNQMHALNELLKNDDPSVRVKAPEHAQLISRQFDLLFQFYVKYTDVEIENKVRKLINDSEHTLAHMKDVQDGIKLADEFSYVMLLRTFLSIDVPFDDAKVKQVINGCNLISNEIADFVGETIRKKGDDIKERAASVAKMIRNTGALLSNLWKAEQKLSDKELIKLQIEIGLNQLNRTNARFKDKEDLLAKTNSSVNSLLQMVQYKAKEHTSMTDEQVDILTSLCDIFANSTSSMCTNFISMLLEGSKDVIQSEKAHLFAVVHVLGLHRIALNIAIPQCQVEMQQQDMSGLLRLISMVLDLVNNLLQV